MNVKINNEEVEAVSRKDERKDGSKYIDKNGKEFTVVSIKLDEGLIDDPDWNGWCSVMDYSNTYSEVAKGETLTGYIAKREVGENVYWNFRYPSRVDEIEERVESLENAVEMLTGGKKPKEENIPPKEEEKDEEDYPDLPF